MKAEDKEKLRQLLAKLIEALHLIISEGLKTGTLKPRYQPYFRWKLIEFEYSDTGIKRKSAKGQEFAKPYWRAAISSIWQIIINTPLYRDIFALISTTYEVKEAECDLYLIELINKVGGNILAGKNNKVSDAERYINLFLKDLEGENQEYRAEVKLAGLLLQSRSIQLDKNTRLRKPTRRDFERAVPVIFPSRGTFPLQDPTAFLHVRVYDTKGEMILENEIDRSVALLRLFRVGAVQDLQHSLDTSSIIHMAGGTLTTGRLLRGDTYLITKEDVKTLKKFWSNMKSVKLPTAQVDELSIAYDRYSDSLEGGSIEKHISSAVMGLEALYLKEVDELSYRLSMRVGKLLSLTEGEYKPGEVRDNLKVAYKIRNKYVHGVILKTEQIKKLVEEKFAQIMIDYLRASIVALLKRPSKDTLISQLDDSFLDSTQEEEIKKLLFMPYGKRRH